MIWKPQILAAIIGLILIAILALLMGYTEVATACPAGLVALGMKLVKGE